MYLRYRYKKNSMSNYGLKQISISPFYNPFCLALRKKSAKWYSYKILRLSNDREETWTDPWWRSADRSIRQETGTSFVHPYASNGVDSSSCVPQFIIVDRIDGSLFSPARFHPQFVFFPFLPSFARVFSPLTNFTATPSARSVRSGDRILPPTMRLTFRAIKCRPSWWYHFWSTLNVST